MRCPTGGIIHGLDSEYTIMAPRQLTHSVSHIFTLCACGVRVMVSFLQIYKLPLPAEAVRGTVLN